jgi:hypothetical protein
MSEPYATRAATRSVALEQPANPLGERADCRGRVSLEEDSLRRESVCAERLEVTGGLCAGLGEGQQTWVDLGDRARLSGSLRLRSLNRCPAALRDPLRRDVKVPVQR